jgi:hypothetical protein
MRLTIREATPKDFEGVVELGEEARRWREDGAAGETAVCAFAAPLPARTGSGIRDTGWTRRSLGNRTIEEPGSSGA